MGITNWDISQNSGPDRFMFGQSQLTSSLPTSPAKPTPAFTTCTTTNSYSDQNYQNQFGFLENTMNYPANNVHRRHSVAVQPRSLSQSLGDKNLPILIPHSRNMIFQQQQQNRLDLSMFDNDLGFEETEDFSASDVDSVSTSNSSPLVHRKVERSRSEPKAPAELINRVHHKSGGSGSSNSATTGSQQNMGDKRYKTEMCRSFLEGRECTYKEKCRYAHGNYEMRQVMRHPKYRTEYCRPFHATGICSYGHRCNFIHNPDEVMQRRISVSESKSVSPRLSPTGNSLGSAGILVGNNNHGRPRAISVSAAPVENFIGEQKREMGSIGDSLTTLSSSGFASYPSSPMSMSPGVDGMGSWFAHFNSNDVFGSNIDDLGCVTEEVGEQGAWVEALNVLLAGL